MNKLTLKVKTLISAALFVVIFGLVIGFASVYDFEISKILTKNALASGAFYATDFFGVFGEIVGMLPIFLVAAFLTIILFYYFMRIWKLAPLKYFFAGVFLAGGIVAFFLFYFDIMNYTLRHFGNEANSSSPVLLVIELVLAVMTEILALYATKGLNGDRLRKLAKFALVAAVALAVANLLVTVLKGPAGRMRFRSMNFIGDTAGAGFTGWWQFNGQPGEDILALFPESDAFKSFPSGHTCAAGALYALIMLPDFIDFKHKSAKYACYWVPVLFTGLVAISRVVCGAHFTSDVTFGGTIAFLSVMLMREIFVLKGAHFKAVFCKNSMKGLPETAAAEPVTEEGANIA